MLGLRSRPLLPWIPGPTSLPSVPSRCSWFPADRGGRPLCLSLAPAPSVAWASLWGPGRRSHESRWFPRGKVRSLPWPVPTSARPLFGPLRHRALASTRHPGRAGARASVAPGACLAGSGVRAGSRSKKPRKASDEPAGPSCVPGLGAAALRCPCSGPPRPAPTLRDDAALMNTTSSGKNPKASR